MPFRTLCALMFAVLFAGCAPFAPESRAPVSGFPAAYVEAGYDSPLRGGGDGWWKSFNNSELDALVSTALDESFDIATARARLVQLEALARKSGAALWPSLTGNGGAEHTRRSVRSGRDASRNESTSDNLSLGAAMSYELDLWGRVRSERESALLDAAAGREDVQTAAMTVAASVADTWISLVAVRDSIQLVERQIETNRILLESQALRFSNALGTGLDVLQQQEMYTASLADLPQLRQQQATLMTQLAILLGRIPGTVPPVRTEALPLMPPLPGAGIPADVLTQRPDVHSAWLTLLSADWSVSAAQADRMPKLTLSADAAYSGQPGVLFSNWLAGLAAGLTAPLFDGGLRAAEVDRLRGLVEERVQAYGKSVAVAVGEVQDALVGEERQREYVQRLAEQLRYAEVARFEAHQGYLNGRDDFLTFITQHKNVQGLELQLIQQSAQLVKYRIALHRALGGNISL